MGGGSTGSYFWSPAGQCPPSSQTGRVTTREKVEWQCGGVRGGGVQISIHVGWVEEALSLV